MLLGLESPEVQNIKEITLTDICKLLFKLDSQIELRIGKCKTDLPEIDYENSLPFDHAPSCYKELPCIYFNSEHLSELLTEWQDQKNSRTRESTKEKLLKLWKEDCIEEYSQYKKQWNYRNLFEQGEYLARLAVRNAFRESTLDEISNEEIAILNLPDNKNMGFLEIPDGIDEDLPFN